MKKFNINNYMYIQITDKGWKFLKETFNADYIEHRILKQKIQILVLLVWIYHLDLHLWLFQK